MQPDAVTASLDLFDALADAHARQNGIDARSSSDKEFAAQDWAVANAARAGLDVTELGRHAPVDLHVGAPARIGVQVKGLTLARGRVRDTLDYSSTFPSPHHDDIPTVLAYLQLHPRLRPGGTVRTHTVCVADMALVQGDDITTQNRSVAGAGSYGDVNVRCRLMYIGAQPVALAARHGIDIDGIPSLILEQGDLTVGAAFERGLRRAGTITRPGVSRRLVSMTVFLDGSDPQPVFERTIAGPARTFDVWVRANPEGHAHRMAEAAGRGAVTGQVFDLTSLAA